MSWVPSWWAALLLTGASFRLWRLAAQDTILDRPRAWLLGVPGWQPSGYETPPAGYRANLATFLTCPWCAGFWLSCAVYVLWLLLPTATLALATPLTVNAALALLATHLD